MTELPNTAKSLDIIELPALTGTDKQIGWAIALRETTLAHWRRNLQNAAIRATDTATRNGDPADKRYLEVEAPLLREILHNAFAQHTEATWWIENRSQQNLVERAGEALAPKFREMRRQAR